MSPPLQPPPFLTFQWLKKVGSPQYFNFVDFVNFRVKAVVVCLGSRLPCSLEGESRLLVQPKAFQTAGGMYVGLLFIIPVVLDLLGAGPFPSWKLVWQRTLEFSSSLTSSERQAPSSRGDAASREQGEEGQAGRGETTVQPPHPGFGPGPRSNASSRQTSPFHGLFDVEEDILQAWAFVVLLPILVVAFSYLQLMTIARSDRERFTLPDAGSSSRFAGCTQLGADHPGSVAAYSSLPNVFMAWSEMITPQFCTA